MLIRTRYKPDLTKGDVINGNKNVLSFQTKDKNIDGEDYLQITELGWGFVWSMFKTKLKRNRLFLLITPYQEGSEYRERVSFFKIKTTQVKKNIL